VDSEVEGNYRSRGKWYPGVVTKMDNGVYDVLYIDGEKEVNMYTHMYILAYIQVA
jgi:hypothetical protein